MGKYLVFWTYQNDDGNWVPYTDKVMATGAVDAADRLTTTNPYDGDRMNIKAIECPDGKLVKNEFYMDFDKDEHINAVNNTPAEQ